MLDRNAVAVTAISPLLCLSWIGVGCLGGQPAVVTVHVRDKAGDWPLNAVTARVEASSSSAGADFQRVKIVSTTFDGQDAGDIFASSRSGVVRNVVPRGQGAITLTLDKDLEAGEYQLPLHFTAANSGKVRHNIFWRSLPWWWQRSSPSWLPAWLPGSVSARTSSRVSMRCDPLGYI